MKRVKIIERKITVKEYYCPACNSEVYKDCGYCYTCGEKLYWAFNKEVTEN